MGNFCWRHRSTPWLESTETTSNALMVGIQLQATGVVVDEKESLMFSGSPCAMLMEEEQVLERGDHELQVQAVGAEAI